MKRAGRRSTLRRLSLRRLSLRLALICVAMPGVAWPSEYHGQVLFGGVPVPGTIVTLTQAAKQLSTVTDSQGLYQFQDVPNGTWTVRIEMRGFVALEGEAMVSANTPQGAWELDLLPLEAILAQTQQAPEENEALQPRTPPAPSGRTTASAKRAEASAPGKDQPEPPRPPEENTELASEGLLVNGSENNAATSRYSISPAFGNRRPGVKSLYTGSVGFILNNSVFDAKPYSLTGLMLPKASYSRVTGVVTLGGPLRIPSLLPRGPNFFLAYQWTRNRTANTQAGLVPTVAERGGDLSGLVNAVGQPVVIYDATTGLPFTGNVPVSAPAAALLRLYPLPNLIGSTRYNYQTQVLSNSHSDSLQSRSG